MCIRDSEESQHVFQQLSVIVIVIVGLISEEIDFFVLASLAMKLREYTRNTPIRRNPVSKF